MDYFWYYILGILVFFIICLKGEGRKPSAFSSDDWSSCIVVPLFWPIFLLVVIALWVRSLFDLPARKVIKDFFLYEFFSKKEPVIWVSSGSPRSGTSGMNRQENGVDSADRMNQESRDQTMDPEGRRTESNTGNYCSITGRDNYSNSGRQGDPFFLIGLSEGKTIKSDKVKKETEIVMEIVTERHITGETFPVEVGTL